MITRAKRKQASNDQLLSVQISPQSKMTAAAGAVAVALLGTAGVTQGATFTFNKTSGGPYTWNTNGNWTTSPAGHPNAAADIVNLNNNITADIVVDLSASNFTLGVLNLGDSSNIFTIQNGTLTFNNSGAGAVLANSNSPTGSTTGNVISAGINLTENLTITQTAPVPSSAAPGLSLTGPITSTATSGVQTLTISSLGIDRFTQSNRSNVNIGGAITDGGSGGKIAFAQMNGVSNNSGITTLSGANTYSGGTRISMGTLRGTQTSGTPFGTGAIDQQNGILAIAPTTVSGATNVSLSAANATVSTKYNYGGGSVIALTEGGNNSLTFTIGHADGTNVLNRTGRGTLVIAPTAIVNLGAAAGAAGAERLIVNGGGIPTSTLGVNTIVTPTIVAGTSGSVAIGGDFLTYDATDGFKSASALYTARNTSFAPEEGEISNITASISGANSISSGNPLAMRVGAFTALIGSNQTITVGDGTNPAGIILNGGTISGANSDSTLAFGASEAVIYSGNAAAGVISAKVTGTGGLTKFGPNSLRLGNSGNTFSGDIRVNSGALIYDNAGALGAASNTITLMPRAELRADGSLNNAVVQQNIILNGGRTTSTSGYFTDEVVLRAGGSSLATATLFTGIISSGTDVTTSTAGGATWDQGGWARLSGDNTFSGMMRLHASVVVLEHNNALGVGDNTSATGFEAYHSATLGVRGGITIANERLIFRNPSSIASNIGKLHAYENDENDQVAGTSQVATWGGSIAFIGNDVNRLGADAVATLKVTGPISGGGGLEKVGLGIVELSGSNSFGTASTGGPSSVLSGTLRLTNTTGSGAGGTHIRVQNAATLDGTGSMSGGLAISSGGTLAPGVSGIGTFSLTGGGTAHAGQTTPGSLVADSGSHVTLQLSSTAADKLNLSLATSTATINSPIEYSVPVEFAPNGNVIFDLVIANTINYQGLTAGDIPVDTDNIDDLLESFDYKGDGYSTRVFGDTVVGIGEYKYSIVTNAAGAGNAFDAIRLEVGAVPEPSTLGLLAMGATGLLARRRRRA